MSRRRIRYFEERRGRVEIIPMIDVMLFLLVFFIIVTLQMIPDSGVTMQLPTSSQSDHLPHPKITMNLLGDGSIQVKGKTLTADALTQLFAADGDPQKTQVTIAAAKTVAFQHFVTVMDAARKAGVSAIAVATQPASEASTPSSSADQAAPGAATPPPIPAPAPMPAPASPATAPSPQP